MPGGEDPVYELHGLAIACPRPLDAPLCERPPDWSVRWDEAAEVDGPPPGTLIGEISVGDFEYWSSAQGDGRRRWVVRHRGSLETELDLDRRVITLRPDPRAKDGFSSVLLKGSGMAHALAADGHAAMHASAVETGGRAIAFIGPSGRGKTTLAALLCASGARIVTDDVLRCEVADGSAFCFRGSSRLRLRPQAAVLAERLAPAELTADGRTSTLAEPAALSRLPLAALIVPEPSRDATELQFRRLRGLEAATELLRSPRLLGWKDRKLATLHMELSQQLAASVPVLAATIPWGPPFAAELAGELLDRIASRAWRTQSCD